MPATVPVQNLSEIFVEFADTLVDDFDVIDFLHLVTGRTAELVDASVVGIHLVDPLKGLNFMAASDESPAILAMFEIGNHEGPGLDSLLAGHPLSYFDLRKNNDNWPTFGPLAVELGFEYAYSFPMRLRGQAIGALNILGRQPTVLGPGDRAIVQALVDVATIGLLQHRTIQQSEVLAEQLQAALNSRIVIEQAKGALSQFHQVSIDDAFAMLRSYARNRGRRVSDIATLVTTNGPASIALSP